MPRVFNRIRKQLAIDNKFFQYSRYAIGEILLVVIGILIAFQVDTWNESKNLDKEELVLLENLKSEFGINLGNLENVKAKNQSLYRSATELQDLIGKEKSVVGEHNVDSLLFHTLLITDFQPNQFVLSQIKTGEKLDIIKSEELKKMLYEWDKALSAKTEAFNMLNSYFMTSLIPFLDENSSIRNIDFYGHYRWSSKTPLPYDATKMFRMIQFDNRLENHLWNINSFDSSIDTLMAIARMIHEEIPKS